MFHEAQQSQHHPTVQSADGCDHRKRRKALHTLQLLSEVTISLFVAGVVVPSFLPSGTAISHAVAVGSLHTLRIGGSTFSYTLHNLGAAVLGGLLGSLLALAIEFPATFAKVARSFLMFRQADWKSFLSHQSDPTSLDANRNLA